MTRLAAALALPLALAACGGGTDNNNNNNTPPVPTTYSGLSDAIFVPTCATSVCHGGNAPAEGLDLRKANGRATTIDKPVTSPEWAGTQWAGFKRIDPGHPETSAMIIVLRQPAGLHDALKMPTGSLLKEAQIAAIETWIKNGAPND